MANDELRVFKEMYKGRIIEALRRGNAKRPWWAIVDGRRASPSRQTTSTFTSPRLALKCAKDMIDDQIAYLSQLRLTDPTNAVAWSKLDLEEAERMVRRAADPQDLERARILLDRVKQDLALAEGSLAKAERKSD
jgi:hypothetical protein